MRFVYNLMLAERMEIYEKYKDDKEELKKQKLPTPAKYKDEYKFLKEVDSGALANAQMNLQSAYNHFFNQKDKGFPRFKSKKKNKNTYTVNNLINGKSNTIRLENGKIRLLKVGFVKIKLHRQIPHCITDYITAHEVGHVISFNLCKHWGSNTEKFTKYLKLRNASERLLDYNFNGLEWDEHPLEWFAEDFRYFFGCDTGEKYWGLPIEKPGVEIKEFMLSL